MDRQRKMIATVLGVTLTAIGAPAQTTAPRQNPALGGSPGLRQNSLQSQTLGSVPTGTVSPQPLSLSLADAIERGLRQNLGLLLSSDAQLSAQGQLVEARSPLLPDFSARISENAQKVNLAAEGFAKVIGRFPGFPLVVGPFGYFDARLAFSQTLLDLNLLASERSSRQNAAAAKLSYQDMREAVVLVVGAMYLQTIAAASRVDTADAQVQSAQALYNQAVDMRTVGISAGIDVLRARVELQSRRQQLIAARNDFAKQKLALARVVGLPLAQDFTLTEKIPYEAPEPITVEETLQQALKSRADFQAALSQVHAAEQMVRAAAAEHLPSLSIYADYGAIGQTPSTALGTFTTYAALRIPIFAGGRAHGDAQVAQAELNRSRQELENLRAQVEQDVRDGILDLQAAADQVSVAMSNVDLAERTLTQARDRFASGATDNIEVVQAQEAVASANESYIASLYAYNLARVELARASGSAERGFRQYWKEK
ncbi:MAG: TolC family protein [Acidobacteria bacterium]|nr:MAG: TolC family protein [Acidobacteriota bacterium]